MTKYVTKLWHLYVTKYDTKLSQIKMTKSRIEWHKKRQPKTHFCRHFDIQNCKKTNQQSTLKCDICFDILS